MISKEEIVSYIGSLSSEAEALLAYSVFHERIPEYKFIFASEKGGIPGLAVNHSFPSGGYIRSLFKTERILVLDPQTFRDMKFGQATYPIDYSISLDTQALSYLVPYIKTGKAVLGFDDVFNFISRLDVNVDPSPYMGENLFRLNNKNELNKIFEK
ncbi:hypothetical protein [Acetobacter syzygii]|uniref:hypothetical protein n=1 Tax=Acetobacter syzygii TaxID=146476 RepID=UPI0015703B35|nr:hypothetical protein [Acetobacter syzygii]NSL93041.1 hypothetical protein [Acetobacter syzygii]